MGHAIQEVERTKVNRTGTNMMFMAVLTTLGAVGIGFYTRFLVALCRECKPHWMNSKKPTRIQFRQTRTLKSLPVQTGFLIHRSTVRQTAPIITFRASRRDQI